MHLKKVLLRLAYIASRILKDSEVKLCACLCELNNLSEAQWQTSISVVISDVCAN